MDNYEEDWEKTIAGIVDINYCGIIEQKKKLTDSWMDELTGIQCAEENCGNVLVLLKLKLFVLLLKWPDNDQ